MRSADRHPELRLVPHRRRRRLLHAAGSDRLDDRVRRIAGRRRRTASTCGPGSERSERSGRAAPPRRRRRGRRQAPRRRRRPRRRTPRRRSAAAAAAPAPATSCRRRRPATTFRFYWNTPFMLSPHNPSIVYLGGNRLFKSTEPRRHLDDVADLTQQHRAGTPPDHGRRRATRRWRRSTTAWRRTATSSRSAESPVVPGIVWVGTNDGNVQVSRDGGATWKNVVGNVHGRAGRDARRRGSSRRTSTPARATSSFDGHRTDDHKPYVFVTQDYGADVDVDRREPARRATST